MLLNKLKRTPKVMYSLLYEFLELYTIKPPLSYTCKYVGISFIQLFTTLFIIIYF